MTSFLVNYGGPPPTISSMESSFDKTLDACEKFYHSKAKSVAFTRNGLNLTYYQVGIHRMIKVELPDQVSKDLKSEQPSVQMKAKKAAQLYRQARIQAADFNTGKYQLLANNCVTAVANVLNIIDPSILEGKKKVVPQFLDSNVNDAVLFESMVEEGLRGTTLPPDQSLHKDYTQVDSIASQVWQQAMTPVEQIPKKQAHAQSSQSEQHSVASQVWNEVMTPVGKQVKMKEHVQTMQSEHQSSAKTPSIDKQPTPKF